MANDYCTITEIKSALVDSGLSSSTDYDDLLTDYATRASRLIDTYTHRKAGAYAMSSSDGETRYYTGSNYDQIWVDEMASAPSYVGVSEGGQVSASDYTTVASTDYFLYPDNAAEDGEPYCRLDLDTLNGKFTTWYGYRRGVKITGVFGYALSTAIPDEIVQAAITTAARWFKRGAQGYQDTGAIPELGQLRYTKALDPDVAETITPRPRVGDAGQPAAASGRLRAAGAVLPGEPNPRPAAEVPAGRLEGRLRAAGSRVRVVEFPRQHPRRR